MKKGCAKLKSKSVRGGGWRSQFFDPEVASIVLLPYVTTLGQQVAAHLPGSSRLNQKRAFPPLFDCHTPPEQPLRDRTSTLSETCRSRPLPPSDSDGSYSNWHSSNRLGESPRSCRWSRRGSNRIQLRRWCQQRCCRSWSLWLIALPAHTDITWANTAMGHLGRHRSPSRRDSFRLRPSLPMAPKPLVRRGYHITTVQRPTKRNRTHKMAFLYKLPISDKIPYNEINL